MRDNLGWFNGLLQSADKSFSDRRLLNAATGLEEAVRAGGTRAQQVITWLENYEPGALKDILPELEAILGIVVKK